MGVLIQVPQTYNGRRTKVMFRWNKLGRVFNPSQIADRPEWMFEYAQAPWSIEFSDFIRVYFCCRPPKDSNGQFVSYCAYVDFDKTNLFKILRIADRPVFELGGKGCFDEFGTYPVSVIKEKNSYIAYYTGHTRCESVPFDTAIGIGISNDEGKTFTKMGKGPVLGASLHEPFVLSGPKIKKFNNIYYLYYIAGREWILHEERMEVVYKIRLATSTDGISWSRQNKNIIVDRFGANEVQASPDVFFKNGKYHMFFCYMVTPDFRSNPERSYRIGYASSTDLLSWSRDDSKAGIDVSDIGFDNEMVAYPHVFELNDKTYMLYLGNQVGRYGFGLAELEGELL